MSTHSTTENQLEQPKGQSRLARALVYFAAYITLGMIAAALGPTLPGLADQTGTNLKQISILFMGNGLGVMAGSFIGGWIYDRLRGHPVLMVALSVMVLALFAFPLMPTLWLLVLTSFLIGAAMGFLDVGGNILVVWLFGRDVDPYMNALHLFFGVGAVAAPLLADRVVITTGGIRWVYWTLAILVVPIIVWLSRLPSPQPREREKETKQAPLTGRVLALVMLISALFFLHVGSEISYGGLIFSYGVAVGIKPDTIARVLNSVYWGAFTLARLISVPLATRLKPGTILTLDILGGMLSISVVLLLPNWMPAVWIATFGLGFSIASMFPTCLNFAERHLPITGKVTSYMLIGGNLGAMALPWMIGQLFESAGPQSLMWVMGSTMTLAFVLFMVILWYSQRLKPT